MPPPPGAREKPDAATASMRRCRGAITASTAPAPSMSFSAVIIWARAEQMPAAAAEGVPPTTAADEASTSAIALCAASVPVRPTKKVASSTVRMAGVAVVEVTPSSCRRALRITVTPPVPTTSAVDVLERATSASSGRPPPLWRAASRSPPAHGSSSSPSAVSATCTVTGANAAMPLTTSRACVRGFAPTASGSATSSIEAGRPPAARTAPACLPFLSPTVSTPTQAALMPLAPLAHASYRFVAVPPASEMTEIAGTAGSPSAETALSTGMIAQLSSCSWRMVPGRAAFMALLSPLHIWGAGAGRAPVPPSAAAAVAAFVVLSASASSAPKKKASWRPLAASSEDMAGTAAATGRVVVVLTILWDRCGPPSPIHGIAFLVLHAATRMATHVI